MMIIRLSRTSSLPLKLWRLTGRFSTTGTDEMKILREKAIISSHIINMIAD